MRNVDAKAFRIAMINANCDSFVQLSNETGIDKITLSNVCNGKQKPSYDTIEKLADALHLAYEEIGSIFFYRELAQTQKTHKEKNKWEKMLTIQGKDMAT